MEELEILVKKFIISYDYKGNLRNKKIVINEYLSKNDLEEDANIKFYNSYILLTLNVDFHYQISVDPGQLNRIIEYEFFQKLKPGIFKIKNKYYKIEEYNLENYTIKFVKVDYFGSYLDLIPNEMIALILSYSSNEDLENVCLVSENCQANKNIILKIIENLKPKIQTKRRRQLRGPRIIRKF